MESRIITDTVMISIVLVLYSIGTKCGVRGRIIVDVLGMLALMLIPWVHYFRVKIKNQSVEANMLWRERAIWFDAGVLIFVGALAMLKIALGWI